MTDPRSSLPVDVLIAAEVDASARALIAGDPRLRMRVEPSYTPDALIAALGLSRVVVTRYQNAVTAEVLSSARALELIVQGTSGLDNIDHAAAASRGIVIVGIPGQNANAVAELVISHSIALTRTVARYDREVRRGVWERSDCALRRELRGYRLGIVGLGRVGSAVARLARAFGVAVRAFDPYLTPADFEARLAGQAPTLRSLLEESDILTLHVPLTPETRTMIGAEEIALLPDSAIVINACRGAVTDVDALLDALACNRLAGLALDVFDPEPPTRTWPADDRLILTPHVAGCSRESKESIGRLIYLRICEHFGFSPHGAGPAS